MSLSFPGDLIQIGSASLAEGRQVIDGETRAACHDEFRRTVLLHKGQEFTPQRLFHCENAGAKKRRAAINFSLAQSTLSEAGASALSARRENRTACRRANR